VLGGIYVKLVDEAAGRASYTVIGVELNGGNAPVLAAMVESGEVCIGVEALERGLAVDLATGRIYPTRRFTTRLQQNHNVAAKQRLVSDNSHEQLNRILKAIGLNYSQPIFSS